MRRILLLLVGVALVATLFPNVAHACSVCFDLTEKNRIAFFTTTIFLSALPLGMIAGTTYWIKKKNREPGPDEKELL